MINENWEFWDEPCQGPWKSLSFSDVGAISEWQSLAIDSEDIERKQVIYDRGPSYSLVREQAVVAVSEESAVGIDVFTRGLINQIAAREMNVLASKLPRPLATSVSASLASLWEALEDEPIRFIIESGRAAMQFLGKAEGIRAPQISVTNEGLMYLQWCDRTNIVGLIVKPNGTAVWSSTKANTENVKQHLPEAGVRNLTEMPMFLRAIAPWVFDEFRRRAA